MTSGRDQAEVTDHQLEVPVFVEQRVTVMQAVRSNDKVDGLPHRKSERAKPPGITRGNDGDPIVHQADDLEAAHLTLDTACMDIVARSLQKLQKHQITDQDQILRIRDLGSQLRYGGRPNVPEVIDPDRAIDNDHRASRMASTSPSQPMPRRFSNAAI